MRTLRGGAIAAVLVRPSFDIFFGRLNAAYEYSLRKKLSVTAPFVLLAMDIDQIFQEICQMATVATKVIPTTV